MNTEWPATSRDGEVDQLGPWFHNIHLPDGRQTSPSHPFGDFPRFKWLQIAPYIAEDLTGWSVLDIGCNAGFYSIELAQRGAQVTGIDIDPVYLKQAEWAVRQFGLEDHISLRQTTVYELGRESQDYDLVWFMGVFYHLRYPLLALDTIHRLTRRQMVFQTLTMPGNEVFTPPPDLALDDRSMMLKAGWPVMAFIERRMEDDPTNWWAPNHSGVEALLRSSGFRIRNHPGHEIYVCEPESEQDDVLAGLRETELAAVMGVQSGVGFSTDQAGVSSLTVE
jgi:tRNA (mo5U34)-methyltransferase